MERRGETMVEGMNDFLSIFTILLLLVITVGFALRNLSHHRANKQKEKEIDYYKEWE